MGARRGSCAVVVLFVVLGFSVPAAQGEEFNPGCELPFDRIKETRPIDKNCGPGGNSTKAASVAQNKAKNNFCADGKPVTVTFGSFKRLQAAAEKADIPFGSANRLPPDRAVLVKLHKESSGAKLGEGTVVRFTAFIASAHFSNLGAGEAVNCKTSGQDNNDIHIALVYDKEEDDLCNSVTAEISPHFRPEVWEEITHHRFGKRPIRITGPLFFDASHQPCKGAKRASPPRFSLWEIHPVYALDVCKKKTLASCKAGRESDWMPFDEWAGTYKEEDDD